jgi:hypothetical protein
MAEGNLRARSEISLIIFSLISSKLLREEPIGVPWFEQIGWFFDFLIPNYIIPISTEI